MDDELAWSGLPTGFGKARPVRNNHPKKQRDKNSRYMEMTPARPEMAQIGPNPLLSSHIPRFPTATEYQVIGHGKIVTALAFDKSGNRMFSGSADCTVKYWNFAGMKVTNTAPEVSIELDSAYEITGIDHNGELVLVSVNAPEISLFDSKGLKKGSTRRGDMYLYDLRKTYGHVAPVSAVAFCPNDRGVFASCSADGTVRIWDVKKLNEQKMLFRIGQKGGSRIPVHALAWKEDTVFACGDDSCMHVFENDQHVTEIALPETMVQVATYRNRLIATRSSSKVYVWDTRNPERALIEVSSRSTTASLSFSPDGGSLLIPEMVQRQSIFGGSLRIFGIEEKCDIDEVMLPRGVGARCAKWHENTNQIAIGCSDGITRVTFDPTISKKGVLLSLAKGIARKTETDNAVVGSLIPRLVDPETERVITVEGTGFWFPYSDAEKRDKRAAQEPKAPIWGEGHHGQIATHPRQAQLRELQQVDEPDDGDIVESLRARQREAEVRYFTSVRDQRE